MRHLISQNIVSRGFFIGTLAAIFGAVSGNFSTVASAATPNILDIGFENANEREGPCGTGGVGCNFWILVTPLPSYTQTGCLSGNWCGGITDTSGSAEKNVLWDKIVNTPYNGKYWRAAWKFPSDFKFPTDYDDWKAMLWEGNYRLYLNFKVNTASPTKATPTFCVRNCQQPSDWIRGNEHVMADGAWHTVEVFTANNRLQLWYDDQLEIDITDANITGDVFEWKVGAYHNGTYPKTQTFYMDNIGLSTQKMGTSPANGANAVLSPPSNLQVVP